MSKVEEIKHLLEVSRKMKFDKTWPITEDEVIEFITSPFEFGFVCGALWQKQQDQSTIELAEDHAMLAGMEKMREEMMAKAIDGEVGYWNLRGLSVNVKLPYSVEDGDKVKVILIKED